MSRCEIRPGIGLCDECTLPKWPQLYLGYGIMVCLDCLVGHPPAATKTEERMKKVFEKIDELCANSTPVGICMALKLTYREFEEGCGIGVHMDGVEHLLPDTTNLHWRRRWRSFLTDHANEIVV